MSERPPPGGDDPDAQPMSGEAGASNRKRVAMICAWCRRFHAPDGTWQPGRRATDATVPTHGICPDCAKRDDLNP